jgi:hypothetical protein
MKQLQERDQMGVFRLEAYARERPVISAAVATVFGKQEWMVNTVSPPERNTVLVVLQDASKGCRLFKLSLVVGIQPDEQKRCRQWVDALVRPMPEARIELGAWVRLIHATPGDVVPA